MPTPILLSKWQQPMDGVMYVTSYYRFSLRQVLIGLIYFFQKVKGEKDGVTAVSRFADPGACSENRCDKATAQGATGIACCCDSELCNAGPRSISTITFTLIALLVVFGCTLRVL